MSCKEIKKLEIKNTRFKHLLLNTSWMDKVKADIHDLTLRNCELTQLGAYAFQNGPFTNLRTLIIITSQIKILRNISFIGLHNLETFEFRNYGSYYDLQIEEGALIGMSGSLTILQISQFILNSKSIINLTGQQGLNFKNLLTLDLRYNNISELTKHSFSSVQKVRALHLSSCNLNKIDQQTFWSENSIQSLYLNDNNLKVLPIDTFSRLTNLKSGGLHLDGNDWECNCSLKWLQEYYLNNNSIDKTTSLKCSDGATFENVEFCSSELETTTTLTESTTILTASTTHTNMKCRNYEMYPVAEPQGSIVVGISYRVQLLVNDSNVIFEFQEFEDEPFMIKIVMVETISKIKHYSLIWFNSANKSERGCVTRLENNMLLDELNRDTMYIMSLLYSGKIESSLESTFGIKTQPKWGLRTWIHNKHRVLVIGLSVLILAIFVLAAVMCTYFCIRRYYKLEIYDKNRTLAKAGRFDRSQERDRDIYAVPESEGYLTPKYHSYSKIKIRPPLTRSKSESSSVYYAMKDEVLKLKDYNDFRPPLPPPNEHSRKSILSN